jgi:hypothetical protein
MPICNLMKSTIKLSFFISLGFLLVSSSIYAQGSGGIKYSVSADTCSVTASTDNTIEWKFYANGPVRTDAIIIKDRVCFGSDDGFVYCLNSATGELIWKFRCVLSNRKVISYGRLISMWPIRGMVVHEDSLYFAAGQWPMEGVFIYRIDPMTGEHTWIQDRGVAFWTQGVRNKGWCYRGIPIAKFGEDMRVEGDKLCIDTTRWSKNTVTLKGKMLNLGDRRAVLRDVRLRLDNGNIAMFRYSTREEKTGLYDRRRGIVAPPRPLKPNRRKPTTQPPIPPDNSAYCWTYHLSAENRAARSPLHGKDVMGTSGPGTLSQTVKDILTPSNTTEGYVLVWGVGNGKLVKELASKSSESLRVIAIDPDAKKVNALRTVLEASGKYDALKMMLLVGDPMTYQCPPYMASVITSQDIKVAGFDKGVEFVKTLYRSVRPYGGAITLALTDQEHASVLKWIKKTPLDCADVERNGGMTTILRTGAIPGAANPQMTRIEKHEPRSSLDWAIKAPLGVLWYGHELPDVNKLRFRKPHYIDGIGLHTDKLLGEPGDISYDHSLYKYDCYTGRVLTRKGIDAITQRSKAVNPPTIKAPVINPMRRDPITWNMEDRTIYETGGSCVPWNDYGYMRTGSNGPLGYYCQQTESGTMWVPGIRAACKQGNIIPACGLLNVAGLTAGCSCPYPLTYAVGFVGLNDDTVERWCAWHGATFGDGRSGRWPAKAINLKDIRRLGVNFGSPGQRHISEGTLWAEYPQIGPPMPTLPIKIEPELTTAQWYYRHSSWIRGGKGWPWVSASGVMGLKSITVGELKNDTTFIVRLYFSEPDELGKDGSRIFDVKLQGTTVLTDFDVVVDSGGALRSVVKQFSKIKPKDGSITIELTSKSGDLQIISGIELIDTTLEPKPIPVLSENHLLQLIKP